MWVGGGRGVRGGDGGAETSQNREGKCQQHTDPWEREIWRLEKRKEQPRGRVTATPGQGAGT